MLVSVAQQRLQAFNLQSPKVVGREPLRALEFAQIAELRDLAGAPQRQRQKNVANESLVQRHELRRLP
jgi:hypothetical protein